MNEPAALVYDPAKYGPDANVEVWGTPPGEAEHPDYMPNPWTEARVYEVRSPSGAVLWRRE